MVISDFRALAEPANFTVLVSRIIFRQPRVKRNSTVSIQWEINFMPEKFPRFKRVIFRAVKKLVLPERLTYGRIY
jgi:hypothetical protein